MEIGIKELLKTYKSKEAGLKALERHKSIFPIKPSSNLAGIVGDLMGDGHLQGKPYLRLDYTSKSKKELKRFEKIFFDVFKVKGKIRKCTTNKYGTFNYGVNCKPIARALYLFGVPTGAKVLKKFLIPKWILSNKVFFASFVRRLFDCEGTIDMKSKYIEIQMYKNTKIIEDGIDFFQEIKENLDKYFNIKSTNPFLDNARSHRKDGIKTRPVRLKIKKKDSLKNFAHYINFDTLYKKERLDFILKE